MQLSSLDSSFTNDVVFHSLFYAAAVCSTLAEGKRSSSEVTAQMGMTIWSINRLLQGDMGIAGGMLGAVCHLAMGEVSSRALVPNEIRVLIWSAESRRYVGISKIGLSI